MTPAFIVLLVVIGLLIQFGIIYGALMLFSERERKLIRIQTALLSRIAVQQGVRQIDVDALYINERLKILL